MARCDTLAGFVGLIGAFAAAGALAGSAAGQTFHGPLPYQCTDDSPFRWTGGYAYLENFEDHALNTPGVTASSGKSGGVTGRMPGAWVRHSVDCDDGMDGSGSLGDSYTGGPELTFRFSAAVLGSLPTRAGLVVTRGWSGSKITFEAFDADGESLGTLVRFQDDPGTPGDTTGHRFYGVEHAEGVSAIRVSVKGGDVEVDHVQYSGNGGGVSDFNGDGFIDFFDYADFVRCYETGACPAGRTADVNGGAFAECLGYDRFAPDLNVGC